MSRIAAEFSTRREAELAVEHLVQEHGLDRSAVTVMSATDDNTAGTEKAGADADAEPGGDPALAGRVRVSAEIADGEAADRVRSSFETYGGIPARD